MNRYLKNIHDLLLQNSHLSEQDKKALVKAIGDADKQWSITEFKLDRTEKVKRTTTILLEETIEELEQKRKAVEAQNKELAIEAALEKIRSRSLAMHKSDELWEVVAVVFEKLQELNFSIDGAAFIITFLEGSTDSNVWLADDHGQLYASSLRLPYYDTPSIKDIWLAKEAGLDFFSKTYSFEEKNHWLSYAFVYTDLKILSDGLKNWILEQPCLTQSCAFGKNSMIGIHFHHQKTLSNPEVDILKRFSKVFDQAYIRFLDLQNAEAQAKEAQIEAALERIRAGAMAMQSSDELIEVSHILREQMGLLGQRDLETCVISLYDEGSEQIHASHAFRLPGTSGKIITGTISFSKDSCSLTKEMMAGYSSGKKEDTVKASEQEMKEFLNVLVTADPNIARHLGEVPEVTYHHFTYFTNGALITVSYQPPSDETKSLQRRAASVFDLAYRRYFDLKSAEAQAREAQIELGLERVRARAMAMQSSSELSELVDTVFKELTKLDFALTWCIINIIDENSMSNTVWAANPDIDKAPESYYMKFEDYPFHRAMMKGWKERKTKYVYTLEGVEKKVYDDYLFSETEFRRTPEAAQAASRAMEKYVVSFSFSNFGGLQTVGDAPLSDANLDILSRFGKVFDLTYTRFNDLKQAEAQAREAQIQLALERVRARTMAMQRSEELQDTAALLFQQVNSLGVTHWACGFNIYDDDRKATTAWMASEFGKGISSSFKVPINEHIFKHIYDADQSGESLYIHEIKADKIEAHYRYMFTLPVAGDRLKAFVASGGILPTIQILHAAFFSRGYLLFISQEPVPDMWDIFKRFAKVFEQTYTRFLDLQKAEAQSRESQIEAALERIRSRTMAMQKSDELTDVAGLLFAQVSALGIKTWTAGFNVWSEDNNSYIDYITSPNGGFIEPYIVHTGAAEALTDISNARKSGVGFDVQYVEGEKIKQLYRALTRLGEKQFEIMLQDGVRFPSHQYEHFVFGSKVSLMFITYEPVPEAHDLFKRLGKVFEQTYTRFLDLKNAEAQAKEAIKRASVDRIRAEIASMRTTGDLERITPLIWDELTTLGVPFIRCGVFIMDEERQQVQTHLSTPGGEAIATFNLPYNAPGETAQILEHWYKKELYKQHWDEAQFVESMQNLVQQGAVTSGEKYLTETRPTDLYLHFLPFLQGMLYVGNTSPLNDDELQLVQNLADAFSTAYARYEDFNKLEAAKKQVDSALNKLQATQKQLIQSEKMASLGELTAGIAHEIQNPLNFVNNFSEVNKEMLEELKAERLKPKAERDEQAEEEIIEDVIANEEKINHHGKRADAIVKGMLQHSRQTSGTKELADINALADEYLRLSYHGLRAKDNSFNATLQTDFDNSIGKIKIIPQDIGRVLLNLFNNAFYAVNEKQKNISGLQELTALKQYHPTVSVATKALASASLERAGAEVEIRVSDNGNGIPQKVLDKIFQPFFTTKPTGEGTGLGLSLSYDIVKAHGGEIKVQSKEGEGSEFIVRLVQKDNV